MSVNPYSSPEVFAPIEPRQPSSSFASASYVLNIVLPLTMFTLIGFISAGMRSRQSAIAIGVLSLFMLLLQVVAAGLGVVGLVQAGRLRLLGALGAIFVVTLLGLAALYYST